LNIYHGFFPPKSNPPILEPGSRSGSKRRVFYTKPGVVVKYRRVIIHSMEALMQTSNPTLKAFENNSVVIGESAMTINGTIAKTAISLAILFLGVFWSWRVFPATTSGAWLLGGSLGGFVLALIIIFNSKTAPYLTPIYAGLEGLLLGTISSIFNARYPGLAAQAVCLTAMTAVVMLVTYRTGLIRSTEKFRSVMMVAMFSIMGIYLIDFILGIFGKGIPLSTSTGTFGILFSVFVVAIAALNLILDFGFIEECSKRGLPKYMEWYGAFALMVTLVWLYLEILRLLSKLQSRH
jgi:uncharacterized YccA/Bax inhibitor family protein